MPKLGKVPIEDLDQQDIKNTLAPLWHTKADTARKALNRLNIVFRHAAALGLNVIALAKPHARDGYLFPSVRKGVISDATTARFMDRRGMKARPHGFRSNLRIWLAEATDAPHEVAETLRGHATGTAVARAYRSRLPGTAT